MPTLGEALHFARDPGTTAEQLRRACALLFLETSGGPDELRVRLVAHLETLSTTSAVVCLNPKILAAE